MTITADIYVQDDPENMCRRHVYDFYFAATFEN